MVIRPVDSRQQASISEQGHEIWHGVIGTGQSLSVGFQGQFPGPTAIAPGAYKLIDSSKRYDIEKPDVSSLEIVPLTEPLRDPIAAADQYPGNLEGKTPHHSMALQIAQLCAQNGRKPHVTVHSAVGKSGAPMYEICKDGEKNSYAASIYEIRALTRLAKEKGAKLIYDCILLTHGESDALLGNNEYGETLVKLVTDYMQDLTSITGQEHAPLMILSQQATSPGGRDPRPNPVIQKMWQTQAETSNAIICSGPKYQFGYAEGGLHLPAAGYDRLGEKYGQAYYQTLIEGEPFVPLSPKSASMHDELTIIVDFHIPAAPLDWDPYLPSCHPSSEGHPWADGRGFEVRDNNGDAISIESVNITADGTSVSIKIRSSQNDPRHLSKHGRVDNLPLTIAYAMTQDQSGFLGGFGEGRLGHLRDSDPLVGATSQVLTCQLENGSRSITCPERFEGIALYDNVEPGDNAIVELDPMDLSWASLGSPWMGSSGWQELRLSHNQRNYLVSFSLTVES